MKICGRMGEQLCMLIYNLLLYKGKEFKMFRTFFSQRPDSHLFIKCFLLCLVFVYL